MKYKNLRSRSNHNVIRGKTKSILLSIGIGLVVVDGLIVGIFQAFPATAVSTANLINFNTNTLGHRKSQKIYNHVNLDQLSPAQKKDVSFTDNNYVSSIHSITDYLGDNSKLYLQGYVAVPNVGIYQPIYYGTSNTVLANGAGTAKDNQTMGSGNYAISAHNMGSYVNWTVPVPSVSGGYIKPGKYFTSLQTQTPSYIYTTDGVNIYKYKEASRIITNVGDGDVLSDTYPYDSKTYSYPVRDDSKNSVGTSDSVQGLGLGGQNNVNKTVGTYKLSTLVNNNDKNTVYTVKYKTDYKYADSLKPKNFKIDADSDGIKLSHINSDISKVSYENGEVSVSFKLSGDVSDAAATIGSQLSLHQLQDQSFVTLTTCLVPASGLASPDRIINTGELVNVTKFKKSPQNIQKLFPDLLKTKTSVSSGEKGISPLSDVKLTLWQKFVRFVGNSLLKQSQWLSKHI